MKIKIWGLTLLFALVTALMVVITFSFAQVLQGNQFLHGLSRGYFSDDAIHAPLPHTPSPLQTLLEKLQRVKQKDFVFLYDIYGRNLRQIYFKGDPPPVPLLKGRFFHEEDFFQKKRYAVVGKTFLAKHGYKRQGEDWVDLEEDSFQVIGVMGYSLDTLLEDQVMVNADALMKTGDNTVFLLDGHDSSPKTKRNLLSVAKDLENQGMPLTSLRVDTLGSQHLLGRNKDTFLLFFLLSLCGILSQCILAVSWFHHKRPALLVMDLVGWSSFSIKCHLCKTIGLAWVFGLCLGFLLFSFSYKSLTYGFSLLLGINLFSGLFALLAGSFWEKRRLAQEVAR